MSGIPGTRRAPGRVDRSALPRYPDGSPWWPAGLARDADDDALASALRDCWATPAWVLDVAEQVRELVGGPVTGWGFDLDAGTRPGTASWKRSYWWMDGFEGRPARDALQSTWSVLARTTINRDPRSPTVWTNFPFSSPQPWIERAIAAAREGCWVSVLAPHTTGAWWDDLRAEARCEVPLRRVEFEACPGLLDARGEPATGDRPSQQCSLLTLAPASARGRGPWLDRALGATIRVRRPRGEYVAPVLLGPDGGLLRAA